ncbi:hypothetical protein SPRG_10554 [Saprolegnia parasitica CBS 223.65]|uniref:Uncharacterized protein n=1 Tax=Saprolegnia parasitica (strain CBS 223.65) TaxID=695850 RepID=A0A067CAE6_SAPPC|nr:hypothetical protein SPRG_10554 [Saprolegnia parasitica CBS 223.65]KDO23777.1 hypothetical protein SPRG_10554 [Saprolegnia parasitica CBS 223.65]|eukprot:XP_012205592.1 hypothetical protein SPRG_10554 [Saprolegnia parasitica CBS 223.65]
MRVGSVDQTPLRVAFCLALMESLYEALLNQKTSRVDALDAVAHVSALIRVFGAALATFQRMPMEGSRRMLPDIFLQTVELVLLESPSDELLQFALDADEYSLLCVVVRSSHAFSEAAWTNLLLPYARSELAKLPLQGVSGSQRDQEVVNLIREACRLYYLNIDRVPSAALGKNVFFSVTQAIRHGYYETERFTELLALVMHRHYLLGHLQVYQWLPMLLLPTVASNLKTSRALAEALWICLGLETSSFGCENAIMSGETSKEVASTFCVILARLRTEPADIFWRDLCLHFGAFLGQHRDAMRELLASIAAELEENEARGCIAVDRVVSLSELLHAMSMRVETADDAFRLFQCGLRVVQMGVGQPTALALDSTLTNAVEKLGHIKLDDPTLDAFESALMCCAVQTRTALAHLVPQLCLEDVNAIVRQQALRHLLAREDLIQAHGITLIRSLYWIHKPIYQSVDVSSQLCLDQLSLSLEACPVLVVLARVSPLYITEVVLKLLSAADLHAMNDPLSESRFIEAHLDAVAVTGPRNALVRFALSKDGLPTLPLLVRLSAQWHQLLMDMVATGLLREETMLLLPQLYPRLERLLSKTATRFQCTAKGREVLSDAMATEDAAHQVHFWNQLHQLIAAEFERGDAMKALRMASTMKTWYPDDYSRLGTKAFVTDTIFPHVQRTAFPQCFDAPTLEAFAIYFRTMHEVKLLFPDESEKHLDISAQIDALARAKLLDVVRTSGVSAAKAWINVYGLHDLLPMLDEMHETDGPATPLLAVRVPWAATAVNVMDGELKTTSLDAIILATDKML